MAATIKTDKKQLKHQLLTNFALINQSFSLKILNFVQNIMARDKFHYEVKQALVYVQVTVGILGGTRRQIDHAAKRDVGLRHGTASTGPEQGGAKKGLFHWECLLGGCLTGSSVWKALGD